MYTFTPASKPKSRLHGHKARIRHLFVLFLLVTASLLQGTPLHAQTFPPPNSCTSKDLELISAILPAPSEYPCKCDGTRRLVLGVRNKTGSTRTAFALWGTLKRYNAKGEQVDEYGNLTTVGTTIFACAGPIKANSDNFLPATSGNVDISVSCGQTLEIVNLYLAWTTANSNETCDFLKNNTANISPKCGILPSIKIGLGVTAEATVTDATCTASGAIKVAPSGGVAPYKVKINQDERANIATGGTTTFNLPAGNYTISVVDSRGCPSSIVRTVGSAGPPDVSGINGAFTKTCISNTSGGTIGETAQAGYSYAWSSPTSSFTSTSANPVVNPDVTTTYTVRKTNISTGCFADASVTVTVDKTPPPTTGIGGAFTKTCINNINGATIGETPVSGFTYSWAPATGLSNTAIGNPTANPGVTTTYTITKTNTANGCTNTAQVVVTVDQVPPVVSGIGGAFTKTCISNTNGNSIGETAQAGFTYSWTSVPAGFTSANANPTVNPTVTTVYTVRKTNNSNGCYAEASVTVTVNTSTPSVSGIGGAFTKTCISNTSGSTIGETILSGFTYSWSPATGLSAANIGNPIANPTTTTTYTVTKTETATGCTNTAQVVVTVDQALPPVTGIGGDFTKTCINNTAGATIGETPVSGFTYAWLPATGLSNAAIGNPIANPATTTTYTVTKTSSTNGCVNTAQVVVTVNTTTPNVSGIGGGFIKTCTLNTSGSAIGETAQAGYTYSWTSVPAGFTSASANPTVNPSVTTVYTVRKTNTTNGCYAEVSVTVTVNTTTPEVNGIGGDFTKTCISKTSGATIGETPLSGFTYSWAPATGLNAANIGNPIANPATTTTYTVTKTNTANGCSNTAQVVVTVNQTQPVVSGIGGTFTKTCINNTNGATIGETPVTGFTYTWAPAAGLSDAAIGNPTANPDVTTTYTVTKTNTANGCTNTAQVIVTVDQVQPNVSGIGGGFTKTCVSNTNGGAIGETAQSGFSYTWRSVPQGFSSTNAKPTVNPTVTTEYIVRKTNNTNGCYAEASVTVTVNTTTPSVSGIGGAFTKTCISKTEGATIGETPVSGFTYAWSPAMGLSNAAIGNPTANPTATTTYTVTKTNTENGCTNTAPVVVTVNTDKPVFTVCITQPTLCANSGSVTFSATGGNGFEYSINNGGNYKAGSSFTSLASGSVTGFKVKNSYGCESEAPCTTVSTCTPQAELTTTAARTTNVAIKLEESKTKVLAAPNPFHDKIRFQLESAVSGYGSLELFNAQGQKIGVAFQGHVEQGRTQTIEYMAPSQKAGTILYLFRVGSQQVLGKLIQLKP